MGSRSKRSPCRAAASAWSWGYFGIQAASSTRHGNDPCRHSAARHLGAGWPAHEQPRCTQDRRVEINGAMLPVKTGRRRGRGCRKEMTLRNSAIHRFRQAERDRPQAPPRRRRIANSCQLQEDRWQPILTADDAASKSPAEGTDDRSASGREALELVVPAVAGPVRRRALAAVLQLSRTLSGWACRSSTGISCCGSSSALCSPRSSISRPKIASAGHRPGPKGG